MSLSEIALIGLLSGAAQGAVIDFNSISSVGNPTLTSLAAGGFDFTSGHFHTIDSPTAAFFGGLNSNGTIFLLVDGPLLGEAITIKPAGGGTFQLSRLDASPAWADAAAADSGGFPNAQVLNVLGNLAGGGTVSAAFPLGPVWQSFALPAVFAGLTSAILSGSIAGNTDDASISFDNIIADAASPAPEPPTYLLMAIGAVLLVSSRIRIRT